MRHKHGIRGGNTNATTSIRDAYGFEVNQRTPVEACCLFAPACLVELMGWMLCKGQEGNAQPISKVRTVVGERGGGTF